MDDEPKQTFSKTYLSLMTPMFVVTGPDERPYVIQSGDRPCIILLGRDLREYERGELSERHGIELATASLDSLDDVLAMLQSIRDIATWVSLNDDPTQDRPALILTGELITYIVKRIADGPAMPK